METTPPFLSSDAAKDIVSAMLRSTGDALIDGDFSRFCPHFSLPYTVETFDGAAQILHLHDLKRLFDGARAYYAKHHVSHLLRTCLSVHARDADTLTATYETLLVPHSGAPLRPPYWCNMDMRRDGETWRIERRAFAIVDDDHHARVLLGAHPDTQLPLHDN